jgi:hypothetical protein
MSRALIVSGPSSEANASSLMESNPGTIGFVTGLWPLAMAGVRCQDMSRHCRDTSRHLRRTAGSTSLSFGPSCRRNFVLASLILFRSAAFFVAPVPCMLVPIVNDQTIASIAASQPAYINVATSRDLS